jgi:sugar phosphate isomerase/epimerase
MGFDGIEFTDGYWTESMNVEKAKAVREYAIKKGLDLVAYCTGFDFINGSDGKLSDEIKRAHAITDFVAELGVKNMRFDVAYSGPVGKKVGISYDACLSRMAEGCREVSKIAESKGIGAMTENHGYFSQDSSRVEKLINETKCENFGALVDIGNFACSDADHNYAVGLVSPYAFHAHAKDFHKKSGSLDNPGEGWFMSRGGNYLRGSIIGHGDVPVRQCVQTLKRNGYDDFLTIEFEGLEDALYGIRVGIENLKRFIEG